MVPLRPFAHAPWASRAIKGGVGDRRPITCRKIAGATCPWGRAPNRSDGKPVALRAPTLLMHVEAIRAGTGRGVIPCYIGDGHRLLERLTATIPELAATYWMIVHRDLRRSACVRAVIDWMRALFAEQ